MQLCPQSQTAHQGAHSAGCASYSDVRLSSAQPMTSHSPKRSFLNSWRATYSRAPFQDFSNFPFHIPLNVTVALMFLLPLFSIWKDVQLQEHLRPILRGRMRAIFVVVFVYMPSTQPRQARRPGCCKGTHTSPLLYSA